MSDLTINILKLKISIRQDGIQQWYLKYMIKEYNMWILKYTSAWFGIICQSFCLCMKCGLKPIYDFHRDFPLKHANNRFKHRFLSITKFPCHCFIVCYYFIYLLLDIKLM